MNSRMQNQKSLLAKTIILVAASFLSSALAAPVDDTRNFARENENTQVTTQAAFTTTASGIQPTFATLGTVERFSTLVPYVNPTGFRARIIYLDDDELAIFNEYATFSRRSPREQSNEELASRPSTRFSYSIALPLRESDYIESEAEFQQILDLLYDSRPGDIAADRNNYAHDDEDIETIMRRINLPEHQSSTTIDDNETGIAETQAECPICLEAINYRNGVALDCGHIFHRACITTWINYKTNPNCPLCRKHVPVNYA